MYTSPSPHFMLHCQFEILGTLTKVNSYDACRWHEAHLHQNHGDVEGQSYVNERVYLDWATMKVTAKMDKTQPLKLCCSLNERDP